MHEFIAAARRWKILGHRPQRPEYQPSFLLTFAVSNFFRHFLLVDQTGDPLPGVAIDLVLGTTEQTMTTDGDGRYDTLVEQPRPVLAPQILH